MEQSSSLELLFPCLTSAAPRLPFLQLCKAQGEHNELLCNSEGMEVLALLLAPEFSDSSGSAEQEGTDVTPKGSHMWLCVCLVPASLLSSCYLGLCDAAGFLTGVP